MWQPAWKARDGQIETITVRSNNLSPLDGFVSSLGFFFGVSFWMLHKRNNCEKLHLNTISQYAK